MAGSRYGIFPHFFGKKSGICCGKSIACLPGVAKSDGLVPFVVAHFFLERVQGLGLELYVGEVDGRFAVGQVLTVVERGGKTVRFAGPVFGKIRVGIQLRVQHTVGIVEYPALVAVALNVDVGAKFGAGVGCRFLVVVVLKAKTFGAPVLSRG